ncbi:GNAT family N-acetyltransferase [Streptomyces sp. NPDC050738]|uniref:GNAT family N-acetyltransferase n=1 Tax=Streptomyces sp. NPDC050738 TaxID=3154744 RepID=UPI0034322648
MTTTLRPTGPLQTGNDGTRSRRYEVCVNSRSVGAVKLSTDGDFGPTWARISGLRISEPDRRRGRGTVAALAAEEVLRGWGCGQVRITVPAHAVAALRMADALGYTERNRAMLKQLPERPPELPQGTRSRGMTEEEFVVWKAADLVTYARTWIERGVAEPQARAKAEADHRRFLPDGLATPGASITVLVAGGAPVGHVWSAVSPDGTGQFVYDIAVDEQHRGRGHGRTLMLIAEHEALAAGATRLGLNVFAGNDPAVRLYESLGYETTSRHFTKQLL